MAHGERVRVRGPTMAARWLRTKASSKCCQEVLCSIILTIVIGAEWSEIELIPLAIPSLTN